MTEGTKFELNDRIRIEFTLIFYPTLVGVSRALARNFGGKLKFAKPQLKLGRRVDICFTHYSLHFTYYYF